MLNIQLRPFSLESGLVLVRRHSLAELIERGQDDRRKSPMRTGERRTGIQESEASTRTGDRRGRDRRCEIDRRMFGMAWSIASGERLK
jgi:hypothetical protein